MGCAEIPGSADYSTDLTLARQMVRMYRQPETRSRLVARAKEELAPIRWTVMKDRYLELVKRFAGAAGQALEERAPALTGVGAK